MDTLKQDIISNIVLPPVKYNTPFLITLCGYSGSGKTTIARIFSNILGCYIVGGDKVRQVLLNEPYNYGIDKANEIIPDITKAEINYLMKNNISVVVDQSVSSKSALQNLKKDYQIVISINLKSNEEENIKRLYAKKNKENLKYECTPVYGDYEDYSGMYLEPRKLYDEVKKRKIYDIEIFDYEINTLQSFENVIKDTIEIAKEIKTKYKTN